MHGKVDNDMRKMIKHFEKHSLIDNISTNDSGVNFLFKKRPIKNIIFFAEGKEQLTLNMGTIVKYIYDSYNLDHDVSRLYKEILNINYTQDTVSFKNVYKRTLPWNSKTFEEQPLLNTVYLSNSVNDSLRSFKVDSTTTKYYIDLWNNNTKIKINVTQSMFLYAHYNAADFSLIEDWEKIRFRNVDILKKSFCSLRIPLKNFGISLYLRDTVLLASASAGSLDSLAKAHGLAKVPVPGYFIKGRMDELLKINRKLFTEYAINDSRITLIHALFMNDFSFSLGSIKNPSTLGSISTRYIKNK
jgi:hypothetical protein